MVGTNGGKEVILKTSKNLERLLEHSLSCFCYKADKIVVHDLNIKQDKTILSLEVWYKDKGQQKIKFKNLVLYNKVLE